MELRSSCIIILAVTTMKLTEAISFSERPIDTIAIIDQDTQLNCSFHNRTSEFLEWNLISPVYTAIARNDHIPDKSKYELVGDYEAGDYSLKIFSTDSDDEGIYQCSVLGVTSSDAELIVIEDNPTCTVTPGMVVKENEEVTFLCQVDKGVPPGELTWVMNDDVMSVEKNDSSHTWKYNFTRHDQASEITCKLKYVTLSQPEPSCDEVITIEVQYGPTVDIKNGSHGVVVEDRRYGALCDVDANPEAAVYWQHPSGDTTTGGRLLLENVTRDKGGEYKCFANTTFWDNSTASSEESHFLDVQYEPSVIIRNGSEGVAVEGRMYEAFCDVDANPAAVVYWQHPSGDTTADETLLLDSVSRQQRGEYKCFANNTFWDNTTASSKESHFLDVQFPPAVAVIPEVPRKLGESVQLRCHAIEANPPDVDYTWYLANGDIFSNATIEITNITRDLHGDQFCTANNTYHDGTYGTGSNVTVLDVQYPPVVNNSKVESKEKDTVVLTCNVDSNPYPSEFQWTHDDVLFSNKSTYTINDVTRDDAGNYTCAVTTVFYDNTNATDQGIVYLEVQYLSSVNITILPSKINEGDDVDIHCKASDGNPDSHKIELIFKDETLATNDSQELYHEITDINPGSSGSYQCRAFTDFYDGSVNYSATKEELVVYYSARLIPSEETEFKIEIGDVVDINCTAHGMPVPSIKWFDTNEREIRNEDDNFEIRNHQPIGNVVTSILSVTLADNTYYGEYVCEATNADDVIGDRQSTTIIELVTDNGSDPLIAIITVSVLVLIILIVIIVAIVLYKKRQSKTQNGLSLDNLTYGSSGEESVNVENQRREPDGTSHGDDINPYAETGTFSSLTSNSEKSAQKAESDSTDGSAAAANQQDEKNADDDENIDSLYTKPNKTKATGNIQEAAAVPQYSESSLNETRTLSSFQPQTSNSEKSAQKAESDNTDGSSAAAAQQDKKNADDDENIDSLYAKANKTKATGSIQGAEAVPQFSESSANETGTLSSFQSQTSNSEKSAQKAEGDNTDGSSTAAAQHDNKNADDDENIDSLYTKAHKTKHTGNTQEVEAVPQDSESSANALVEALNGSQAFETDVPGSISRGDDTSGAQGKQDIERPEITYTDLDFPNTDGQIESQQQLPSKDHTDYTTIRHM